MAMTVNFHVNLAPHPAPEKFAKFAKFANFNVSAPRTPPAAALYQRGRTYPCHPKETRDLVKRG
jgi:hypothetical protein